MATPPAANMKMRNEANDKMGDLARPPRRSTRRPAGPRLPGVEVAPRPPAAERGRRQRLGQRQGVLEGDVVAAVPVATEDPQAATPRQDLAAAATFGGVGP